MERKVYDVSGRELAVGMQVVFFSHRGGDGLKVGEIEEIRERVVMVRSGRIGLVARQFNQVSKVAL